MSYSDGTIYAGDISVTLSVAGAVIIEGFTTNRPSTAIQQRTATGAPSKAKYTEDFETASGTIQYNGTKPARFETFTHDAETWIITSIGESHTYSDYDKCPATFAKKYN